MKKVLTLATVLLLVLTLFAGCGKEAQEITVKDQKNSATVTFEKGMTVADLIDQLGLVLNEKDEVTPALDTVLEEPVEISIARYAKVNVVINTPVEETNSAEEATETEEDATSAEATEPASKTVEVELVGGTVADALEKAGVKVDETVTVNFELTEYLSDIEGDIIVTIGEKVADEATTLEDATEVATEEATTAKAPETTTEDDEDDYYYDDEDDTTTTTQRREELTTQPPATEPPTAPPMEPVITEPPVENTTDEGNNDVGGNTTERYLERTEWVPDCDGGNGGYVVYWYSDGTADTEIYEERPDWI
ncbi:MAG: DUF348 domain-containing protein [Ruminococcaceae bacterium]|nr:DUF348 domain-containing protein [Oscillospiraceae bacterium]